MNQLEVGIEKSDEWIGTYQSWLKQEILIDSTLTQNETSNLNFKQNSKWKKPFLLKLLSISIDDQIQLKLFRTQNSYQNAY